ncbi:MAG TPA: hypothetical protein VIK80_05665 [Flavihumibacter sp.]
MRQFYLFLSFLGSLVLTGLASAAQSWPTTFQLSGGDRLKMYDPQPSSYGGGELDFQAAVAYYKKDSDDPVFGTIWAKAYIQEEGSYERFVRMTVSGIKFPADINETQSAEILRSLEEAVESTRVLVAREQLKKSLELQQEKEKLAGGFNNQPPKLIYRNHPSMLVIVDGNPIWKKNEDWGVEAVINSPNTLVRGSDGKIYLYSGKHWYVSSNISQPFTFTANPPSSLNRVAADIKKQAESNAQNRSNQAGDNAFDSEYDEVDDNPVAEVLVSTEPAELIQSKGEASFTPISGTDLLYVENSPNDIFMDVSSQQYYVLLSGRWFRSPSLSGTWQYIPAESLPSDFANIPAGSAKDNVLASVPGTPAASNALMDAQLPQTAKVDRKSATATVEYDGDPEFQRIEGTKMDYAVNTSATVIRYKKKYYLVDNGVWFQSSSPEGPWVASTTRPDEVDLIPAKYPVYPVKYVYIYDVTPDYIYMGYTPGYLNTFIYGPTVVYGTGYYYRPWYRTYYYPRPFTWGFNMHYTPWYGWSIGFQYSPGWFHIGFGYSRPWNYWYGGWWGPTIYRPAYFAPRYRHVGYYGYQNNVFVVNNYYGYNYRNYRYNNVYHSRPAIVSRDTRRYIGNGYTRNYNNRNGNYNPNTPVTRPNRNYTGSNRNPQYNNGNRGPGNRPGNGQINRENQRDRRPDRTYRPSERPNNPPGNNRPGQRPNERPSPERNNRPGGERGGVQPQRPERGTRPEGSRPQQRPQQARPQQRPQQAERPQSRPQQPRQEARGSQPRREAAPSRPSGNSREQRPNNGGSSRPERRGN